MWTLANGALLLAFFLGGCFLWCSTVHKMEMLLWFVWCKLLLLCCWCFFCLHLLDIAVKMLMFGVTVLLWFCCFCFGWHDDKVSGEILWNVCSLWCGVLRALAEVRTFNWNLFFGQSGLLLCLLIAVFRDWISFLWLFPTTGRRVAAVWWNSITCLLLETDACLWKVESTDDCKIVKMLAWPRLIWLRNLSYCNIVNTEISIHTTSHNTILCQRRWSFPCFRKYPIIKSYYVSIEGM